MKKIFFAIWSVVFTLAAFAGANWPYADYAQSREGDYLLISVSNSPGNFTTKRIPLKQLFNGTNQNYLVGDYTTFRTGNSSEPGQLSFSSTAHGGGHGVVILGGVSGDVVVNPTSSDGVFQIGQSGVPGNWIYVQYAVWPYIVGQKGFSHPFGFRAKANVAGSVIDKEGGIIAYPSGVDASLNVDLVHYAVLPHWNSGNTNTAAPDRAGVEILRESTNGIVAPFGIKFVGNGGALTNDLGQTLGTGSASGLTTNAVVMSSGGLPLVQYFTNGSLQAVIVDNDASNYISAVIAAGASLTDAQKLAVTKFTVQRKWFGTWSDSDVIAPMMGGTAAAHLVMLKGTNVASYNNTPTHNSNGVTFNGTDNYLNTGWKPSISANYVQDTSRLVMVIPTASVNQTAFGYFAGVVSTTGGTIRSGLFRNSSTVMTVSGLNNGDGNGNNITASDIRVITIASRDSSTVQKEYFWQNTAAIGAAATSNTGNTTASVGAPSQNMLLGARAFEGFAADSFLAFTISGFESGAKCDATKAQTIRDAWAQLQTDLGR